jgi:hypothetical protein
VGSTVKYIFLKAIKSSAIHILLRWTLLVLYAFIGRSAHTMEEMESVPYKTDIANQGVSGVALFFFFIRNRSVGEEGKH